MTTPAASPPRFRAVSWADCYYVYDDKAKKWRRGGSFELAHDLASTYNNSFTVDPATDLSWGNNPSEAR